ncbi:hypothetical protein FPRO04_14662 [Fusarium proliferatum]|nr:hypothetical protein FPRO04_14662 [Fusarium proliferatum]
MVAAFKEQNFTTCSYCKKLGNTSDACWLLHPELKKRLNDKRFRRKQRQDHPRTNNRTRNADEDEVTNALAIHAEPVIQLMAYQGQRLSDLLEKVHVLDSGASMHTFCKRENFSTLHPWSGGQTVGIGETQITPQGLGNYILRLKGLDGPRHLALDNSVYSPEGRVNLVSISALTRKGAKVSFGDNQARVAYDNRAILTATLENRKRDHTDSQSGKGHAAYDGSLYWVVFVDDFTRMGWAYAVKEKPEFTRRFKHLLDTYERPERRCHYLHVDQGGENRSDQLCTLCDNKGITIYYTATDQHEQNGIAEAFNRVLQEKFTPTLERSNLPRTSGRISSTRLCMY